MKTDGQPATILVTGATGSLGPCVVQRLCAQGYRVRALARHAPDPGTLPPGVEVVLGDIGDAAAVRRAMAGASGVVHLAALLHINNPPPALAAEYWRVNVSATAALVAAAEAAGVRRFVYASTIAVYGDNPSQPLDEDAPCRPATLYAGSKLAGEQVVIAATAADGGPMGVVLRLASIYGPRIKGNYRRLVASLARRRFLPIGEGTNRRTLIFEQDAAAAVVLALAHPAAAGQTFNVTDGASHSVREIESAICSALGRHPPRLRLPARPVRLTCGLLEDAARAVGHRAPVTRSMLEKYREELVVDGRRIRAMLGFAPAYDLWRGWAATVRALQESGAL